MRDITSFIPEAFYDILSILIPGIVFMGALNTLKFESSYFIALKDIQSTFAFLIVSYIIGHILYSASTFIIARIVGNILPSPRTTMLSVSKNENNIAKKNKLFERISNLIVILLTMRTRQELTVYETPAIREALQKEIKKKWKLDVDFSESGQFYFELCRNYVHVRNRERATFIRKEQAYGELSRSITLATIIYILLLIISHVELQIKILYAVISIIIFLAFIWRYVQSRAIDAVFVYTNFIVLSEEEEREISAKNL